MGQGISEVLTFAVGVAISPVPIIAVILMLVSARARVNGPLFLLRGERLEPRPALRPVLGARTFVAGAPLLDAASAVVILAADMFADSGDAGAIIDVELGVLSSNRRDCSRSKVLKRSRPP